MQKGIIRNRTVEDIESKDMAAALAGFGVSGILEVGQNLRCVKVSDNKVTMQSGTYLLQGHALKVESGTTVQFTIDSGTLGTNRNDFIVAEMQRNGDGSGDDRLIFKVLKGTPSNSNAADPSLTQQDILGSGTLRQEALYRLRLQGTGLIAIDTIAPTIPSNTTLDQRTKQQAEDISQRLRKTERAADSAKLNGQPPEFYCPKSVADTLSAQLADYGQWVIADCNTLISGTGAVGPSTANRPPIGGFGLIVSSSGAQYCLGYTRVRTSTAQNTWSEWTASPAGAFLALSGGKMSGVLDMGGKMLTGLPAPAQSNHAVPKFYADSLKTQAIQEATTATPRTISGFGNGVSGRYKLSRIGKLNFFEFALACNISAGAWTHVLALQLDDAPAVGQDWRRYPVQNQQGNSGLIWIKPDGGMHVFFVGDNATQIYGSICWEPKT